jgi:hypothetical protein
MSRTDLALEIKQIWGIDQPQFEVTFTEASGTPETIPRLAGDRLQIEVIGDSSSQREVLLFHEGAHVYLFHLGYPASRTRINGVIPELTGPPVDFLSEHYALKLELEKRFDLQNERVNELRGMLNDALARLPIREDRTNYLQPGSGILPMKVASAVLLLTQWDSTTEVRQSNVLMNASFSDLIAIYRTVLSTLQQAPPLPQYSQKFTNSQVLHIKTILTSAVNDIFGSSCVLEFLH